MKKETMRYILFTCAAIILVAGNANALTITATSVTEAQARAGNGGVILEDFNTIDTGWYESLDTNVGVFTAGGDIGLGGASYNELNDPDSSSPYFQINSTTYTGPYSRGDLTAGGGDGNYFESGDITEVTLAVDLAPWVDNLYFYITDPSDQGAVTTTSINGGLESITWESITNGSIFLVEIAWTLPGESLNSIKWTTTNQSDGWGVDKFGTQPVPEPATMLLFGAGLLGLAGVVRRRKK